MPSEASPRALVVLRVARDAAPPDAAHVRAAIAADRTRLGLPSAELVDYRIAGPYAIIVDRQELDEYVAWEA